MKKTKTTKSQIAIGKGHSRIGWLIRTQTGAKVRYCISKDKQGMILAGCVYCRADPLSEHNALS